MQRFPDVEHERSASRLARRHQAREARAAHKISREELSVREHMSVILRRLQAARFMEFTELFDTRAACRWSS